MRRVILSLAVAATLTAAVAGLPTAQAHRGATDDNRQSEALRFKADLAPLNVDGRGRVKLEQQDGELAVKLRAKGLDDGIHLAHIHGIRQAENECPGMSFDVDDNGVVDIAEGLPAYGPVQITLSDGLSALGDLSQYAIVIHGVDLDGDHLATNPNAGGDAAGDPDDNEISMPALCGTIEGH